jgi:Spy/CpxP family protein refolding chaperone
MYTKKTLLGAALVAALALGTGKSLIAMSHEGEGHEGKGAKMMEKLGLSKEEAAKVQEARKKHRDTMRPLNSKRRDLMEKLEDQVEDKAKDSEISATLGQLEAAQKDIHAAQASHIAEMKTLLTPMQQAKVLLGMKRHMGKQMMKRMHGHGDDDEGDDGKDDDRDEKSEHKHGKK